VYIPLPTVATLSPETGPAGDGTAVTITGANLGEASAVDFGSSSATSFTVDSQNSITAVSGGDGDRGCDRDHAGGHQPDRLGRPVQLCGIATDGRVTVALRWSLHSPDLHFTAPNCTGITAVHLGSQLAPSRILALIPEGLLEKRWI
jgi:hypothetical protein